MRGTIKPRVEGLEPVPEWTQRHGIKKASDRLNLDPHYGVINSSSKFLAAMTARLAHVKYQDESRAWMLEAISDTLESGWDEIDGQIPDPFLDKAQNAEMLRRLPWLVIEAVVDVYNRFQQDYLMFAEEAVFSGMANHVRAKARFLVALDDTLDLGDLRTSCIRDIKAGVNPTESYVKYYLQKPAKDYTQRNQKAVKQHIPTEEIDPYAPDFDTHGPSWPDEQATILQKEFMDDEADSDAILMQTRRGTAMLLSDLAHDDQDLETHPSRRRPGSGHVRVGSAPGLREDETLWQLGVDTRQVQEPLASESLNRHRPPGYSVQSDVLLSRTENRKGVPRSWDTDNLNSTGTQSNDFNPNRNNRVDANALGIPPPPPLPSSTSAISKKKEHTIAPNISATDVVQDYIDSGGLRKSHADLSLVSQKLVTQLEEVAVDKEEEEEPNLHPLLLASSYHQVDSVRTHLANRDEKPQDAKRKLYLLTDRSTPARAAVDAYFLQSISKQNHNQRQAQSTRSVEPLKDRLPIKPDSELKVSNVRVSDRIPRSTLVLESVAPLYREFDTQVDPRALDQMDVRLYRHDEVKQMYQRMLEQLKIDHFELPNNGIKNVLHRNTTEKIVLERAFFSCRAVPGCYSAPGGRPVINRKLCGLPRMPVTKAEQYHIDLAGVSKPQRSYRGRLPKVVANQSAGKDEAKRAYAYNTWLNWWKSTFTTEDYMEYLNEQKTDFLSSIFDLHGSEWEMVDSDEEADNVDPEVARKQAALQERAVRQRREKTTYVRGQWNVNTITMGGLAWNPALHSAESMSDIDGDDAEDACHDAAAQEMQERLNQVWGALQMPSNQKLDMAIKYNSREFMNHLESLWLNSQRSRRRANRKGTLIGGSAVGTDMNALQDALKAAISQWEGVSESILKREELMKQLEVFERQASDPARHFRKERTLGGQAVTRVSEANARGKFHKKIQAIEVELISQLDSIYSEFGDIVTFKGKPYRHKMVHDKQEMLYWLEQERRHRHFTQTCNTTLTPLVAPAAQTATHVQTLGLKL